MSLSIASPPSRLPSPPTYPSNASSGSRRPSPPRTPVDQLSQPRSSTSTPSDDSSVIDDLSFDYVVDDNGNLVRLSKGSSSKSNHSTPPTPTDRFLRDSDTSASPNLLQPPKPPSPISLDSPVRRGSLSRSESAYPALNGVGVAGTAHSTTTARSFQRVASGPALVTSSQAVQPKSRMFPRRITVEEKEARARRQTDESNPMTDDEGASKQDEKENQLDPSQDSYVLSVAATRRQSPPMVPRSASLSGVASTRLGSRSIPGARPLVDVPVPQRASDFAIPPGASRPGRILKSSSAKYVSSNGFERISESEGADSDLDHEPSPIYPQDTDLIDGERYGHSSSANPLSQRQRSHGAIGTSSTLEKSSNRPRRSASLSEPSAHDDNQYNYQANEYQPESHSRPGTSLGLNHQNASSRTDVRRVTDEREREDYPKYYRDDRMAGRHTPDGIYEGDVQHQADGLPSQHRPTYTHRRRDSDTLRSTAYSCNSPTAVEMPRPSAADPKRLSPVSRSSSSAMHRRSPTAPELPTNNGTIAPPNASAPASKTWAPGEGKDSERGRDHAAPLKNPSKQVPLRPPPAVPTGQIQSAAGSNGRQFTVNRKTYARLDMIGKGGTSRVYRVLNSANEVYALKRVSLDRTDPESLSGYTNEIALLKRLDGNSRIIRLIDSELKAGPGGSKGCLMMVMECGEIDLARLLHEQQKEPFNILWVAFYWQQMLQAVHVIHEEKIVHSDLKPANFVLVKGQLKLIDFGIANAIANDTTNIQRDAQIGTVNYMSPEAIELPDGMRRLKVGRPSDIWSLGCILYQMVYGRPPFHNLNMYQKMKAIPSTSHIIDFPEDYTPSLPTPSRSPGSSTPPKPLEHLTRPVRKEVINCMKSCLVRNPKERATIPQLLAEEWLAMERNEPPPPEPKPVLKSDETIINPHYMRQLLQYGIKLGQSGGAEMDAATLLRDAERLIAELQSIQ